MKKEWGRELLDLSIVNGQVVDGEGRPRTRRDVGILKGKIVKIADLEDEPAGRVINAEGLVVAPGFVDIHSHSDWTLLLNPRAESSVRQGVTTEVVGNCGYSYAPIRDKQMLLTIMPEYLRDRIEIDWTSLGDLLQRLEAQGMAINIVHLVGHLAVRIAAMGFDARAATISEVEDMKLLLETALDQGGCGVSFGLGYAPGHSAVKEEMVALCRVVAERGLLCSIHMRNQDYGYLEAVEEAIDLARETGVNLEISHIPPHAGIGGEAGEKALQMVQKARDEGLDVNCDAHPYLWCMGPATTALPPWVFEGGVDRSLERLSDPATREAMKRYEKPMFKSLYDRKEWGRFVLCHSKRSAELVGKNLEEISELLDVTPQDAILDILFREGEGIHSVMWRVKGIDEEAQPLILRDRHTIFGSDGMALAQYGPLSKLKLHPRCWGWTARFLGQHVRENALMTLEEAVHKMTAKAARKAGLKDRGVLNEGKAADVVVFNPHTIEDKSTYDDPNHHPIGIEYVIVNGQLVVERGEHTGAIPGVVLGFS